MGRPARAPAGRRAPSRPGPGRARAAPKRRVPLTRARIVAAALALVERDGLAAFSLRGLGATLGCEPMSLYHHFPSKVHLQDAMVDAVIPEIDTGAGSADPIDRLRELARSWRALAHRHPRLFPLVAVHRFNTPSGVRVIDEALALVRAAVPDDRLAAQYFRALGYYIVGAALDETAGYAKGPSAAEPVTDAYIAVHCPSLAAAAPYFKSAWWDSTFELGLESLLAAMRAEAPGAAPSTAAVAPKPVVRPKR